MNRKVPINTFSYVYRYQIALPFTLLYAAHYIFTCQSSGIEARALRFLDYALNRETRLSKLWDMP